MCGIFGSTDFDRFKTLYELNRSRGDFAFGGVYDGEDPIIPNSFTLVKQEGVVDLNNTNRGQATYYIGHTQAPTSSVRKFDRSTTHPFKCDDWLVAHNGILSNTDYVRKKYMLESKTNDVDTSVIPALVSHAKVSTGDISSDEINSIVFALEELKGTFTCWFYNIKTRNTYLARCGSTLHGDGDTGDFSSILDTHNNLQPLDEGIIYKVSKKLTRVGTFQYDSPYFIL